MKIEEATDRKGGFGRMLSHTYSYITIHVTNSDYYSYSAAVFGDVNGLRVGGLSFCYQLAEKYDKNISYSGFSLYSKWHHIYASSMDIPIWITYSDMFFYTIPNTFDRN